MKKYVINGKEYFTICSVHYEINAVFNRINKMNMKKKELIKEIELGISLIQVAKQMGQTMEDALRYKSIWGPNSNYFSFFNREGDEE